MKRPDHSTYREWLNLDADGVLPPECRGRLDEHLGACAECRAERAELGALEGLLARTRVPARPDFRQQVMSALPSAGWESRSPRTWAFPAALFALLAAVATATLGGLRNPHSSLLSALAAVGGMFRASAAAGAGLIAASWKGLGLAFSAALSSPMSLGAFGIFVLCLHLVLFSLLRRRRPAPGAVRGETDRPDR